MQQWHCRWAPSLGALESTHERVWGTLPYDPETDKEKPTVFFGLYGLPDFYTLWRHNGIRHILWAGSDIVHFKNGYWLDQEGKIRLHPKGLATWINENCKSWVENKWEYKALLKLGIIATMQPSFLGNAEEFPVSWSPGKNVYISCGKGKQEMYGFHIVERIAQDLPFITFHLYGDDWKTKHENVVVHGRVPKEKMNAEIKGFQVALRLNETDGFSEVLAKGILMGQYAVGKIEHPGVPSFKNDMDLILMLTKLVNMKKPNLKVREWYRQNLNNYPWNQNK